jgi:hypothetical protein
MTPAGEGRRNEVTDAAFPVDFLDFIYELNAHAVEYMLVGGYAVGLYGHIRATADIDFFYRTSPDNVERLIKALTAFGAPDVVVDRAQLAKPKSVTQFGEPPTRIDLLAGISGVTFEDALATAMLVEIAPGQPLPVIGLEALRTNKLASGRKKDRDDLRLLPKPSTEGATTSRAKTAKSPKSARTAKVAKSAKTAKTAKASPKPRRR